MKTKNLWVVFLLGSMGLLMVSSMMLTTDLTYDERRHLWYGQDILRGDSHKEASWEDSKMPFNAVNAIPYYGAKRILDSAGIKLDPNTEQHLTYSAARLSTILFSLLLGFYVFKWSRDLYGPTAGFFSLLLYVFSPNIIAHSRLMTTDLYGAFGITMASYHFWKFMKSPSLKGSLLSAATLGVAQLTKYTAIYLYPIFLAAVLIRYGGEFARAVFEKRTESLRRLLASFSRYGLIFVAVSFLIINLGFLFRGTGTPLAQYHFSSGLFKSVQGIPVLKDLPLPFPHPFVFGLDLVKHHDHVGTNFESLYLLGELRETPDENFEGFKGYFFFVLFYKEPIAAQILMLLAGLFYFIQRKKNQFLMNEIYLLLPVVFLLVYFNYFYKTQLGIRYILAILPLLYIFCGSLFKDWRGLPVKIKTLYLALFVYLGASTLSYFPHYIPYFNEFVGDRKKAYRLLADSNIDWGQNLTYVDRYLLRNPEAVFEPPHPSPGKIVVSVNSLVGITEPERYRWLRENFEPVDHIAYSYLVFEVSPEALNVALRE